MVKTIGNPLSWGAKALGGASEHVAESAEHIGGRDSSPITDDQINTLTMDDLYDALRKGAEDLGAARGDVLFLCLIYPIIGLILVAFGLNMNLLPLLFPLLAGFALLGPIAAIGPYEISRRREEGLPYGWGDAFGLVSSPSFGAIVVLSIFLFGLFLVWMLVAAAIHAMTLGGPPPASITAFAIQIFTTGAGWAMILIGTVFGFGFALLVLATSVVSFPLLLQRDVGVPNAVATSVKVFRKNPRVILVWGLIVATGLVLGTIPALIGLIIVLPLLGHATWHLYRRAISV
ncbi:Uncharacterized membrane protein [Jannaschia faecimaris]|uniref:Uncharacterized membrane protein n=1 Tax=Jannaschia faecimaris TaxID=1244108 RepID=A0A1H3TYL1_9RHOB|nr:DUF2189 domain-containing protein [Jannaschia faecimaris]SDZ55280.1 Uncharacterized membrane protein [Jannaschia faecimaris]